MFNITQLVFRADTQGQVSESIKNYDRKHWCLWFPLQVSCDGADGCQPLPGDSDGAGPREAFLPALPDAVWNQTPTRSRHHTQGEAP